MKATTTLTIKQAEQAEAVVLFKREGPVRPFRIKIRGGVPGLFVVDVQVGRQSQTAAAGPFDYRILEFLNWPMEVIYPDTPFRICLVNMSKTNVDLEIEVGCEDPDVHPHTSSLLPFSRELNDPQTFPELIQSLKVAKDQTAVFKAQSQITGRLTSLMVSWNPLQATPVGGLVPKVRLELAIWVSGKEIVCHRRLLPPQGKDTQTWNLMEMVKVVEPVTVSITNHGPAIVNLSVAGMLVMGEPKPN